MKKAFTLTELLVVVAVMIIVAVAAMPAIKALQKSFGIADPVPVALRQAHTAALKSGRYAACSLVRQADGSMYAFLLVEDPAYPYSPADNDALRIALKTGGLEGMHAVPVKVPADYAPALALYDKRGHCCPHRNLIVDGVPAFKSTDHFTQGSTDKYLHRYMGGFAE